MMLETELRSRRRYQFAGGLVLILAGGALVCAATAFTFWLLLPAGWTFRSGLSCWEKLER